MVAIEANFHPDAARTHQAGESRKNPLEKARTLQFPFSKKKETKQKKIQHFYMKIAGIDEEQLSEISRQLSRTIGRWQKKSKSTN